MSAKKNGKAIENGGTPAPDSIEALRDANELFTQFMRKSPVYAYIKSVTANESRILMASDNYKEMLDISNLDIVGRTMDELFPPEFASKITADDWVAFANGKVLVLDKYMNGRDYVTIKFPFVHRGRNMLAGYMVDVTVNDEAQKALRESEENFRRSHDESPLGLCVVTAEGEILYANQAILDMYGFESVEDLKETSLQERYTPECYGEHRVREEKRRRGEEVPSTYEIEIMGRDGQIRYVEVYRKEVPWSGEKQIQLFHYDITGRRKADEDLRARESALRVESESLRGREEKLSADSGELKAREEALRIESESLREREERLRLESDSLKAGEERMLRERETLQSSDEKLREFREVLRKEREELRLEQGKLSDGERMLREEREALRIESESLREREEVLRADSEGLKAREEACSAEAGKLRSEKEKLDAEAVLMAEREGKVREGESTLRAEKEKLRGVFEAVGTAVMVTDLTGKIVEVNKYWLEQSCYGDETEVVGRNRLDFVSDRDRAAITCLVTEDGASAGVPFEMSMLRKDGSEYLCEAVGNIMCDASGNAAGVVYTDRDITRRRMAEKVVLTSLGEKERLLNEINRQAGNSLNAVIALMEMQWRTPEKHLWRPVSAAAALPAAENRVRAMALVHEILGRAATPSLVDMQDYLSALVSALRSSLNTPADILSYVRAEGITFEPETAAAVGMIVNELAANAFKHAFPDGKPQFGADKCEVTVSLERRGDDYRLVVDDNGAGLPKNFRLSAASTLGMNLVKMLGVNQLGGRMALNRTRGTRYIVRFKMKE